MKKLIALLLTVVMVMSIMLPVVATETNDTVAPEAPVVRSVQLQEVKDGNDQITAYNIRFLSTVSSLSGSKLGYEVSAQFEGTNGITRQVYSAANGDTNMEGNTVYSKIYVYDGGGKTPVDAAQLAALKLREGEDASTAKGIFAVAITGVPATAEVIFTVKSYVIYNGEKIESDVGVVKYVQGEIPTTDTDLKIEYQENFNDADEGKTASLVASDYANVSTALLADQTNTNVKAFNTALEEIGLDWTLTSVANYGTNNTVAVKDGVADLTGSYSTVQVAAPGTMSGYKVYSIDMDVTMETSSSRFDILFNNSTTAGHYNGTGNAFTLITKNNALAMALSCYSGTGKVHDKTTNTVTYTEVGAEYNQAFHLTLLVDNLNETLTVLINGTKVALATDNVLMYEQGGGLELIFQYNVKVDNIVMLGQSVGVPSDTAESETLYASTTEDPTVKEDFRAIFNASSRFNKVTVENGKISLGNPGGFYMFELIGDANSPLREKLDNQDKYVMEMNVQMTTDGYLNILFNTEGTNEWATQHYNSTWNYGSTYFFYGSFAALKLTGSKVEVHNYTNSSYETVATKDVDLSTNTVKVIMEVDNTGADSVVNIYVGGTKVIDGAKVSNNDGGIYFWNQNNASGSITVSDLAIYTGAYTPAA